MVMSQTILKEHGKIPLNSRQCYNHAHPVTYPIEYDECPACGSEKITRITLEMD